MSLDLSAVGFKTETHEFEYDWKTAVLYALGIGAKREELHLLYEMRGPRVFPTFPVAGAYPVMMQLIERARAPFRDVVHAGQTVTSHSPIAPNGTLSTSGTLSAMYDLKRMARLVFDTETFQNGELVCTMQWSLLVRTSGGFGGPRPPKVESIALPKDQPPDFETADHTSEEQALLYRLSGDYNPLHADPELARSLGFDKGPILHGLCTLGFLARATVAGLCGGDERRLKAISAEFKKPVWPGERIVTRGFARPAGRFALTAFAAERPEAIVTNSWAEVLN